MEKNRRLQKKDYFIMTVLIILYSILSFHNLGSFQNPNTFITGKTIVLELSQLEKVDKIRYFTGHDMGTIQVYGSTSGKEYTHITDIKDKYVFTWNDLQMNDEIKFIRLALDSQSNIGELAIYNKQNQKIDVVKNASNKEILDEQKTVPTTINSYNSAYFDEIYFARTAYEYAKGLPTYEWVHPPLGKVLMSIPIALFGMSPFTSRCMINIVGILMIPVLYILAKRMFKKTKYAFLAASLLALDGFHFAQTRMASVDGFLVLFLLLSFLFMYEYITYKEDVPFPKKIVKLLLSGLFMGCAIATKWTGFFGGLALAIFFFIHFFKDYSTKEKYIKEGSKIILWCILFFVIIPLVLYVSLYFVFPHMYFFETGTFPNLIHTTEEIFKYHSNLQADHPFYSAWYTWPLMLKPVWYYSGEVGNLKSTIAGIGNPMVWWMGTIAMLYMIYKAFMKNKKAIFLLVTYICVLISYIGISRGMFLYHYFPALPFTILAITFLVKDITEKTKKNYVYIGYLILVFIGFCYFFPIVSGLPVTEGFIEGTKWLGTWYY